MSLNPTTVKSLLQLVSETISITFFVHYHIKIYWFIPPQKENNSTYLDLREMKMETSLRFYLTQLKLLRLKKKKVKGNKYWCECKKGEHSFSAG